MALYSTNDLLKEIEDLLMKLTDSKSALIASDMHEYAIDNPFDYIDFTEDLIDLYREAIEICDKYGLNSKYYQEQLAHEKDQLAYWQQKTHNGQEVES